MRPDEIEKSAREHTTFIEDRQLKNLAIEWFRIGGLFVQGKLHEKTRWIPIEERLPPIGEFEDISIPVHVTDGKLIGHGTYDYDRKLWTYYLITQAEQDDNEITHWMPLIKLPEKQSRP